MPGKPKMNTSHRGIVGGMVASFFGPQVAPEVGHFDSGQPKQMRDQQ
jgi:hypothetical protein